MDNPKVSVIMPIYNSEKFLSQSLGGVLHQTLENIEIICVNDGSTDASLDKIRKYAEVDSRIIVIDKRNSGYGHSMNCGLRKATGDYIAILEPDDFVDNEMFKDLVKKAEEYNADVVKSNYYEYKHESNTNQYFEVLKGLPYDQVTSAKENEWIIHMRPCIWSAIYKKDMLKSNHIKFNETPGASYQDTAFAFKVWTSAERVVFVKNAYLHYRMDNVNSSVNSKGKIFSICDEFNSMQSFLNQNIEKKNRYSKILQVLKLDSYTWNLGRISPAFKKAFHDQIALEFIKADYEGALDKSYFDEERWRLLQNYIKEYQNTAKTERIKGRIKRIWNKIKKQ